MMGMARRSSLRRVQFIVWYLILVFSRRGIQGVWSPSLIAPDASDNFWLAVCAGACMVRPISHSLFGSKRRRKVHPLWPRRGLLMTRMLLSSQCRRLGQSLALQ